jgi:hypothetical protein
MSDLKEEIEKIKDTEFDEDGEVIEEEEGEEDILDVILDLLIETREEIVLLREDIAKLQIGAGNF